MPGMIADRIFSLARHFALLLSALACLIGSAWGSPWLLALGGAVFPVALIALGEPRLKLTLLLLGIVLVGVLAALLLLPNGGPDFGALPLGTALMLFVLVPVPFLLTSWAHAAFFDLREEDLERLRRANSR